jgi:chemotaxis protein methyltransferase CheR
VTGAGAAPALNDGWSPPRLCAREFSLLRGLIYKEAGIYLSEAKKALVVGRLSRRLRELHLGSFEAYYRLVQADGDERVRLLDCICTNETHFFREPRQFEFLEQRVFPEWVERAAAGLMPRRIRAWSAACSTGEEPYSLAMTLLAHFPPSSGWEVDIHATDLSTRALELARAGVWRIEKALEIPQDHLKAFMLRGTGAQEGVMKAGLEIRSAVRFERVNLNEARYPVPGPFDLVFCRNVLIYFDAAARARVVSRLLDQLAPAGHLFLGHAESLNCLTERARSVGPTVYVHAGQTGPGGGEQRGDSVRADRAS